MLDQILCNRVCRPVCLLALLGFYTFTFTGKAQAQSISTPDDVSALVYSRSAVELFWTPKSGTLVEVSRNGENLGRLDARSLFQPNLDGASTYRYTLTSVDATGQRSAPVTLTLRTGDFKPPIKRIYPSNSGDSIPNANSANSGDSVGNEDVSPPPPVTSTPIQNDDPEPTPEPKPIVQASSSNIVQGNNNCIARGLGDLISCVRNASAYQRIDIAQDISCGSNCCPNGGAIVRLDGVQNLEIAGHGHRILRKDNQRQCSLLDMRNASNITVNNIRLDDDKTVSGCRVTDNCPRMVHIRSSKNIRFNKADISHGKGYAFYVQGTNGFKFENSSLTNSGVLGMYIGHGSDASSNIQITHSSFIDNQTNGLALLGVTGSSRSSNLVANNLFARNHRRGQWEVLPKYGSGFTGGGQVYVAQASNVTVRDNIVRDGYCSNCFVQRRHRSGVSGIELGLPNRASVQNVDITGNQILNHDGFGISQNSNSGLSNVQVRNNLLFNATDGEHLSNAQKSGNREINTQHFESFESGNSLGGQYQSAVNCSASGSVTRRCGAESRFGQCAVQLKLGGADCSDVRAEITGPRINVREGQRAVADGWVNNPNGTWCLVFRDASGNRMGEQCRDLSQADSSGVQSFVGLPHIDARAPNGSHSVQVRVINRRANSSMILDDIKLSVGD